MNAVKISIIIPTLNEEEGIAKVICSIPEEIRKISEVIVVDISEDMTPVIAQKLGAKVIRGERRGKGLQMRQAARESRGEILVFLDGDGTDPADYMPKLIEKLDDFNLVLGCRSFKKFGKEDSKMRTVFQIYKASIYPFSAMLGIDVSDPLAGFRAIRRKDWDTLDLKSNGFEIETEMNIKAIENNFTIGQILIPNLKRCGGATSSKFFRSPNDWFKILKMIMNYKKKNGEVI